MIDKIKALLAVKDAPASAVNTRVSDKTPLIMADIMIALAPALFWGIYVYGTSALVLLAVCVLTSIASDLLMSFLLRRDLRGIRDLTAPVIGMMLCASVSPNASPAVCAVLCLLSVCVFKWCLGGTGRAPVHPFAVPLAVAGLIPICSSLFTYVSPDSMTSSQYLFEAIKLGDTQPIRWYDILFGNTAAPIGCASALLLIAGGIYLAVRRISEIKLSAACIIAACVTMYFLSVNVNPFEDIILVGVSGQMAFTAFFLTTDSQYRARSDGAGILCAAIGGALTVLLSVKLPYGFGAPLAIVVTDVVARVADKILSPGKPFGKM